MLEIDLGSDEQVSELRFGGVTLAKGIQHYPFGGGPKSFTRGNGIGTVIGQDSLGRRIAVQGGPVNLTYKLDALGNVETITSPAGSLKKVVKGYSYDEMNQLRGTSVEIFPRPIEEPPNFIETYQYDAAGNRTLKVRNGKRFISVFDVKAGSQSVFANDLLREVIDPSSSGECRPPGKGHENGASPKRDGGMPGPDCPGGTGARNRDLAGIESGWKEIVRGARSLLSDLPLLSEGAIRNRIQKLVDALHGWMTKYDVSAPALQAILFTTSAGPENFEALFNEYLRRRALLGSKLEAEDLDLLRKLVNLAEKAQVRLASEIDPIWRYAYDAAGNVTSQTLVVPSFTLFQGAAGPVVFPERQTTFCYQYDGRRRLVGIETITRSGTHIESRLLPCDDPARIKLAEFRYDHLSRRIYSNVGGVETFALSGRAGELLAEASLRDPRIWHEHA